MATEIAIIDRLREVELFAALDDERLGWLAEVGTPRVLDDGEVLFEDGELARHFYVLLGGALLITKMVDGREQVVSTHSWEAARDPDAPKQPDDKPRAAHQFTGELPLLAGGGYVARATAVGRTELLCYDKETFLEMLVRCPEVCQILLPVLAWRIHSYEAQAGRRAMLAGLGTLTAGLAHEINNPTAAVVRAASELKGTIDELADWATAWGELATQDERATLERVRGRVAAGDGVCKPADALDAADLADSVDDWLIDHGLLREDGFGTMLADHGIGVELLTDLADGMRPSTLRAAVGFLSYSTQARTLVGEVVEASGRVQTLVQSVKSYTNLDRAPVRDVDVVEGLEATLATQASKLGGIRIRRDYRDVPPVTAYPSELNQVWTNLICNAVDAMGGSGELRISTRRESCCAVVEIRDSGPGIPADVLPMLFQPFFTTKDIGKGTGLGLHLSRDIITQRHGGSMEVASRPGDTRFTVRLPFGGRSSTAAGEPA